MHVPCIAEAPGLSKCVLQADCWYFRRLDKWLGMLEQAVAQHGLEAVPGVELDSICTGQVAAAGRLQEAQRCLQAAWASSAGSSPWRGGLLPLSVHQGAVLPPEANVSPRSPALMLASYCSACGPAQLRLDQMHGLPAAFHTHHGLALAKEAQFVLLASAKDTALHGLIKCIAVCSMRMMAAPTAGRMSSTACSELKPRLPARCSWQGRSLLAGTQMVRWFPLASLACCLPCWHVAAPSSCCSLLSD